MKKTFFNVIIILFVIMLGAFSIFMGKNDTNTPNTPTTPNTPVVETTPVDWSNLTISCLGDSITKGQTISTPYTTILQETLGVKNCINYGIGWSTCAITQNCSCHSGKTNAHNGMCTRYSQMPITSDIILVMCGNNDASLVELGDINDISTSTFYGSLNILCSGLLSKYKDSYIVFMTSFSSDNCNDTNNFGYIRKDYYCTAVKEVCQKYDIDIFDTFNEIDFDTTRDTTDGVHPNQNFVSNVWTPAIAEFLRENYKK